MAGTVLLSLNDTDLTTLNPEEDIRSRDVFDADGEKIGHVNDLLLDQDEQRVRFFEVGHGGFLGIGEKRIIIPVDTITGVDEEGVHIDRNREVVSQSPAYDPELAREPDYYDPFYGHYGITPYWTAGYSAPAYPILPHRGVP
jgi:sporulation protein YlmC with PRC-barrel domain